jgi:hypothetical protein
MPASTHTAGTAFAEALARKDFAAAAEVLHPEVDFRGLTPNRNWEAHSPDAVVSEILTMWFEDSDEIEELVELRTGQVADREHVAWRFRGRNPDGPFVVEQQAYIAEEDGRIVWMRVLCSGFRPT